MIYLSVLHDKDGVVETSYSKSYENVYHYNGVPTTVKTRNFHA